jgi:hypothetical protein
MTAPLPAAMTWDDIMSAIDDAQVSWQTLFLVLALCIFATTPPLQLAQPTHLTTTTQPPPLKQVEEEKINDEIDHLLAKRVDLETKIREALPPPASSTTTLTTTSDAPAARDAVKAHAETARMAQRIGETCVSALRLSGKVRQLDAAQSHLHQAVERVERVVDIRTTVDAVEAALADGDLAAACRGTYRVLHAQAPAAAAPSIAAIAATTSADATTAAAAAAAVVVAAGASSPADPSLRVLQELEMRVRDDVVVECKHALAALQQRINDTDCSGERDAALGRQSGKQNKPNFCSCDVTPCCFFVVCFLNVARNFS